jgi:hypothetical protein
MRGPRGAWKGPNLEPKGALGSPIRAFRGLLGPLRAFGPLGNPYTAPWDLQGAPSGPLGDPIRCL